MMQRLASSGKLQRPKGLRSRGPSAAGARLVVFAFVQMMVLQTTLSGETKQTSAPGPHPAPAESSPRPATQPKQTPPWQAANQLGGDVQPWAQMLRATAAAAEPLSPEVFERWFAPLEGAKSKVRRDEKATLTRFSGLWKLRAPWPEDAVLRLRVAQGSRLRVHLWQGPRGVSLLYGDHYKAPHRWIAYEVTRQEGALRPDAYATADDDGGRYARVQPPVEKGRAPIILPTDISYQDGKVVVSCGGVRLLAAPLGGRPEAVCVEEAAPAKGASAPALLTVRMVRADAPPEARPPELKTVLDLSPASLDWKVGPATELVKLGNGHVWLSHPRYKQPSWAATPIPKGSIREFVFEIEKAQPGSGVYLGDSDGAVLAALRISASSPQAARVVRFAPPAQRPVRPYNHDSKSSAPPWVGRIIRLRILLACGTMKAWVGTENGGWAALWPETGADIGEKTVATVGVYCAVRDKSWDTPPRGITLRSIKVREYSAVSALAPEDLIRRAPDLHAAAPDEWLAKASAARPGGAAAGAWLRACAIRSIADGAPARLGVALVDGLAADAMRDAGPWQGRIELLHQLAAVTPSAPSDKKLREQSAAWWGRLEDDYDRAAREAIERDGGAFAQMGLRVFDLTPPPGRTVDPLWQRLARRALVSCALTEKGKEFDELDQRLRAYHRPGLKDVSQWCRSQSQHPQDGSSDAARRHPWQLADNRTERSFKIDFGNAVNNGQLDRACRLFISRYADTSSLGLVRDPIDPRGWTSLQESASRLMRRYPRVQRRLIDEYTLRGKLRVRQAIADRDAGRVALAAAQFYGTPAAADAHVWLGDRAYLAGRFNQAAEHYASAAESADVLARGRVLTRHRLAAARLGRKVGRPATEAITIGETTLSPQKIEQEVARALQAARGKQRGASDGALPWALPQPAKFNPTIVNDARQMPPRPPGVPAALWKPQAIGQLITLVPHGSPLSGQFLCRREGNVLKCTKADGKEWQTAIPELVKVAMWHRGGKTNWVEADFERQPRRPFMVSQPVAVDNLVYALFEEQTRDGGRVTLQGFELAGGKRVADQTVFWLRQFTSGGRNMLLKIAGDRYLIWYERGVMCGKIGGAVNWARFPDYQALSPADAAARTPGGRVDRLVIDGERVYIADAGMPYVECIDLARGVRGWVSPPLEVVRAAGRVGDRLVVETADELVGLDPADGRVVWRRAADHLPDALAADEAGGLLYARRTSQGPKAAADRVELVWVDPKNGQTRATASLDNLFGPNVPTTRFGPFIGVGRELIALAQSGQPKSKVQAVRLTPSGAASAAEADRERQRLWRSCLFAAGP